DGSEMGALLAGRSFLAEILSPEALAVLAADAPASVLLQFVAAAGEEEWERLREPCLAAFRGAGVGAGLVLALWKAAWGALEADTDGRLTRRLLDDPEFT